MPYYKASAWQRQEFVPPIEVFRRALDHEMEAGTNFRRAGTCNGTDADSGESITQKNGRRKAKNVTLAGYDIPGKSAPRE
jgi:hypothetical protein